MKRDVLHNEREEEKNRVNFSTSIIYYVNELYYNLYTIQQGYPRITPTQTTTTSTTTTQKPIILVEKSVLPPLAEIPSSLVKLNEIPKEIAKGMIWIWKLV